MPLRFPLTSPEYRFYPNQCCIFVSFFLSMQAGSAHHDNLLPVRLLTLSAVIPELVLIILLFYEDRILSATICFYVHWGTQQLHLPGLPHSSKKYKCTVPILSLIHHDTKPPMEFSDPDDNFPAHIHTKYLPSHLPVFLYIPSAFPDTPGNYFHFRLLPYHCQRFLPANNPCWNHWAFRAKYESDSSPFPFPFISLSVLRHHAETTSYLPHLILNSLLSFSTDHLPVQTAIVLSSMRSSNVSLFLMYTY